MLTPDEKKFLETIRAWNFRNDNLSPGPTIFLNWFRELEEMIWKDELEKLPGAYKMPDEPTLIEALKRDSIFVFTDNVNTPEKESLEDVISRAFKKACSQISIAESNGNLSWNKYKDTGIRHLLRMEALSRFHLNTGGGRHVINATQQYRGPSWKMIVQLTDDTEAYGIYPGGQHGNAGSRYYDTFINDWAIGKYYRLWHMKKQDASDKRVVQALTFAPAFKR